MSYKTIMAGIGSEQYAADVIEFAGGLATRFQGHLIGVYVVAPTETYVSAELPVSIEVMEAQDARERQRVARLSALFAEHTRNLNTVAEWRAVDAVPVSVSSTLIDLATTADLLVMSRGSADRAGSALREVPEGVIAHCPRPVLVVPDGLRAETLGQSVLVAWNGGHESTRALYDALPLLQQAERVRLLRLNLPSDDRHRILGLTEELAATLARHDVKVDVIHADARGGEVAAELLGSARDMGADLLVMGAYGHSRLRQILLGGTTRSILRDMHLPVLMSH